MLGKHIHIHMCIYVYISSKKGYVGPPPAEKALHGVAEGYVVLGKHIHIHMCIYVYIGSKMGYVGIHKDI